MENYIAKVYDYPAVAGEALLFAFFLMVGTDVFNGGFCEGVDHAVAGAGADDEIISKRYDIFQVDKDDVFPLFVFKGIYDFTSKY